MDQPDHIPAVDRLAGSAVRVPPCDRWWRRSGVRHMSSSNRAQLMRDGYLVKRDVSPAGPTGVAARDLRDAA